MGQKTGTSKTEKKVMKKAMTVPRVQASQNLNSGKRRVKGRNSLPSFALVGSVRPSSLAEGSSKGLRKAIKLFNKNIPRP